MTTSAISCPASTSAASGGTASRGVPRKTIRKWLETGLLVDPLPAGGDQITVPELAQRLLADVGLEPIQHQLAVEVVHLVQEHPTQQLVGLEDDLVAAEIDARES